MYRVFEARIAESVSLAREQVKLFREMCDTNRMPAITPPQRTNAAFYGQNQNETNKHEFSVNYASINYGL